MATSDGKLLVTITADDSFEPAMGTLADALQRLSDTAVDGTAAIAGLADALGQIGQRSKLGALEEGPQATTEQTTRGVVVGETKL